MIDDVFSNQNKLIAFDKHIRVFCTATISRDENKEKNKKTSKYDTQIN